ncbi:ATP-dependent zinc protease family protein [Ferrimonas pelagia]|uniref:RimK/LysX family protein n=1 Tax=Ferrimonas pelagia TaxID=1177826 RepID=A0ABP9EUX8_9GAMM
MRTLLGACLALFMGSSVAATEKGVVGPVERLYVVEAGLTMAARIDTGASKTSIHAEQMEVVGGELADWDANIGKALRFVTRNGAGKPAKIEATIAEVTHIRNSQGSEDRYVVWLTIGPKGNEKRVLVTLKDRAPMSYKLLIGRNWLAGDYLVDVDLTQ